MNNFRNGISGGVPTADRGCSGVCTVQTPSAVGTRPLQRVRCASAESAKGSSIPGREILEDLLRLRFRLGILSELLLVHESHQFALRLLGL